MKILKIDKRKGILITFNFGEQAIIPKIKCTEENVWKD